MFEFRLSQEREAKMNANEQIKAYLKSQPEAKRHDMQSLHSTIVNLFSGCRLSFLDGRDDQGRIVTNPNIGYGHQTMNYADGRTRDFYQIGMSANTAGISIYIMGLKDKKYLSEKYGKSLGKAVVTGYCIKFKKLSDINLEVLTDAIRSGIEQTGT
jgi:hypothetical protein